MKNFHITTCGEQILQEKLGGMAVEDGCESAPGLIPAYSSVVLTHAFMIFLERLVAGYLSRSVKVRKHQLLFQIWVDMLTSTH